MGRTFEELAAQELDRLYQGALFLSGGNERGAETLLIEALTRAHEEHPYQTDVASIERWLEARLVRSFLKHLSEPPTRTSSALERVALREGAFEDVGSDELFRAARSVPPLPRAVLWLVLLRRWSYADVASTVGIEPAVVPELLRYRDVLMREIMAPSRRGNGSTGRGS
jgi:DNA-directed RNA polymerase specialized sigma24 family protein